MAKKYGFDATTVEQASYEKAPALLRDLAAKGNKLIILHSSGYAAAVEQVAPQYPDTQFVVFSYATDTKGLKNYSAWSYNFDEYGFVAGAAAGAASKAGNIAIIAAEPIPSTKLVIDFMSKGAKHVNPGVKTSSAYTGSFDDAAKANEIATQALA
jgi:basic membrane protein A